MIDGVRDTLIINDFEPIPLVDLLDSMQAASCHFLEGLGQLESFNSDSSDDHICSVRSLMLTVFSTFYDIDTWCLLDIEDLEVLAKLKHPNHFRIRIDGVLREINHNSTVCHGLSRHTHLRDLLSGDCI